MKISWKHLHQFVDLENVDIEEAANKLTLAGYEIENISYAKQIQDTILDISITTNRQDIAGCAQVSRELSAILKRKFKISSKPENIRTKNFFKTENLDIFTELYACSINHANIFYEDKNAGSYINAFKAGKTNSILDIVEMINSKWGQSIYAYSLKSKDLINIENLRFSKSYKEQDVAVNKARLHIGNQELSCITAANVREYRNASSIILTSCTYKQKTGQSNYANQKSTDYSMHAYSEIVSALKQAMREKHKDEPIYHYAAKNKDKKHIKINICNINKILGPVRTCNGKKSLDSEAMLEILHALSLNTEHSSETIKVTIPTSRQDDISNEVDIAEEIARIYGFNHFYDCLPCFKGTNRLSGTGHLKQKVRSILRSMGIHEIINFSLKPGGLGHYHTSIINPLNQEQEALRQNLISGILAMKTYNNKQANYSVEVFEIGTVFIKHSKNKHSQEVLRLSCLLDNERFNKTDWQKPKKPLTWLQAKGHAEELLERINAQTLWSTNVSKNSFTESLKNHIHSSKSIYIVSNRQAIGVLSQVKSLNKKELSKHAYFIEIDLDELIKTIEPSNPLKHTYYQYSSYPKINRDFSIKISSEISMETLSKTINFIKKQKSDIIESVTILSEYYDSKYEKTICLRATYRSKHKTLTNEDVKILDDMFKAKFNIYARARHKPGSVLNKSN